MAAARRGKSVLESSDLASFIGKQDLRPALTRIGKDKVAQRAAMKDPRGFLLEHGIELPRGVKASIEQLLPRGPEWPRPIRLICIVFCRRYGRFWICWRICIPILA